MKPVSIAPKATTRAAAFELWMNAPNPTVTFFKTLDVTPLVRLSRRRGLAIRQHRGQHHRKEPPRRGQLLRRAVFGQP